MARDVIHISETEAASNLPSLLERVRAGCEFIIERDAQPVAVLLPVTASQLFNGGEPSSEDQTATTDLENHSKNFFAATTLEQLAEVQSVKPLDSPGDLAGGWPANENVDEFIAATYHSRT